MDGIANPSVHSPRVADRLLWVVAGSGEPAWAVGGSYNVVRLIRMFIEFWDRVSLSEQQKMIGGYRGAALPSA
jgi:deferrochelatase/peroxidase EfeB